MPVVFNDFMNTLRGDPSTEKLLPLVRAAAEVGAEVFCIDAGWYADGGNWWDGVGEWRPSTVRFPGGLEQVLAAIRTAGMVPGLWVEPEVVGVRSPVAADLPDAAFLSRKGQRVVERDRYHLDCATRKRAPTSMPSSTGSSMSSASATSSSTTTSTPARVPTNSDSVGDALSPEQAASWAYPQPGMTPEEAAFCLVTGMLGRYYVSGHLDRMTAAERSVVAEAIDAATSIRPEIIASTPGWPLGLPRWTDDDVCLALSGLVSVLVSVWRRGPDHSPLRIPFPQLAGRDVTIDTVFPRSLPAWDMSWSAGTGELVIEAPATVSARTLRLVGSDQDAPGGTTAPDSDET